VGNASGGRQYTDDRFVHKSLKVNEYLVKAKSLSSLVSLLYRCGGEGTHPGVGGGTHRRRATFERCEAFVGGVREGLGCCSCRVCACRCRGCCSLLVCVCV